MSLAPRYCRAGHGDILSFLHSCHFYTLKYRQIISQCDVAGSGILVHQESGSCSQGEGTCEGEIGEYFIGEDVAKGDTEWEGVSLSPQQRHFIISLGTHTFIKARF